MMIFLDYKNKVEQYSYLAIVLIFLVFPARSDFLPADQMIITTTSDLLSTLSEHREKYQSDSAELFSLVEDIVVPIIALEKVTRLILGNHWKVANEDQRTRFAENFKNLLIHSYATAMFEYEGDEEIQYGDVITRANGRINVVPSKFIIFGKDPISVDYFCLKTEKEGWKIFDIQIDGVSIIVSYRSQYGDYIAKHGIDALLNSMEEKISQIR